jgi:hypothetical protein
MPGVAVLRRIFPLPCFLSPVVPSQPMLLVMPADIAGPLIHHISNPGVNHLVYSQIWLPLASSSSLLHFYARILMR